MDNREINLDILMEDVSRIERRGKYECIGNKDAVLLFGAKKGIKISDLVESNNGRNYLVWLLKEDFPKELHDIITFQWYGNPKKKGSNFMEVSPDYEDIEPDDIEY